MLSFFAVDVFVVEGDESSTEKWRSEKQEGITDVTIWYASYRPSSYLVDTRAIVASMLLFSLPLFFVGKPNENKWGRQSQSRLRVGTWCGALLCAYV